MNKKYCYALFFYSFYAFFVSIAISLISISFLYFDFEAFLGNEIFLWVLSLFCVLLFLLLVYIKVAYVTGYSKLIKAKQHSNLFKYMSLLPIVGIFLLVNNKNKFENVFNTQYLIFKKTIFYGLLAIFIPLMMLIIIPGSYIFIQHNEQIEAGKSISRTVHLINPDNPKKIVFEGNDFILTFGLKDFKSYGNTDYIKNNLYGYNELGKYIDNALKTKNEVNISNTVYAKEFFFNSLVADLLESGKLILYDKNTKKFINSIKVETLGYCEGQSKDFIIINKDPSQEKIFYSYIACIN